MKKTRFKFSPFSKRQRQLLNWWVPGSPVENYSGIIADGAIRSGKTLCMCISFVMWALTEHDGETLGMCGKTIGSFRRNVLGPMKQALPALGYEITDKRADNLLIIKKGKKSAEFYIFGSRDERSQDLIQGITLSGIFLDEVVLMPRSFVEQAMGRCSVAGSKIWMNCNPGNAGHWIKKEWIDQCKDKQMLYLHFTMDDNLSLSKEIRDRYRRLYIGTWFRRYILGEWVAADGLIYDMIDIEADTVDAEKIAEEYRKKNGRTFWKKTFVSVDYGTSNATAALLWSLGRDNVWYIRREYYHSGRDSGRQKTDRQYSEDIIRWLGDDLLTMDVIVVDPFAAASFKVQLQDDGLSTEDADNSVLDGIRETSTGLGNGEIKIDKNCEMLLEEISGYVWDSTAAKHGVEKPVKENDHACDALRYGWMHVVDSTRIGDRHELGRRIIKVEKKIFRFPRDRELTPEDLAKFIRKNDDLVARKYKPLRDAYEGKYKIFFQPKKPAWKPDNRLAVNFARYITDTFSGYIQGVPQQVISDDSGTAERVTDYNDAAGFVDQLAAAVDSMLIYGRSYLMAYEDENGDIGVATTDPEESFIIYDEGIRQRPLYFVRTYYDIDRHRHGSVSDGEGNIRYFDWAGAIEWTAEERHGFDGVPAVELSTGIIRKGIFADVLNLIDAFNQLLSDKANDISMFADAYLKILGADIDDKSLKWIRNNRVINLKGRNASDLVVEFLEGSNADGSQENLLNRLYELIFVTAMVVNISDADFTAASGQAMKYRLQPMTNMAGKINRRLTKSLKNLYKLICSNPAGDLDPDDWQKIEIKYTLNLPANLLDEAQTAGAMSGITSKRTQLQVLSIVPDVDKEMEQIEKENDVTAYMTEYETDRGGDTDEEENGDGRQLLDEKTGTASPGVGEGRRNN